MGWRDKRKIMQSYDVTAEMYDERYAEEQTRKYSKALENVNVTSKTVLDVGCGSGLFFTQVANKAGIVVGVDLSRKLLIKAKKHIKAFQNVFVLQAPGSNSLKKLKKTEPMGLYFPIRNPKSAIPNG